MMQEEVHTPNADKYFLVTMSCHHHDKELNISRYFRGGEDERGRGLFKGGGRGREIAE